MEIGVMFPQNEIGPDVENIRAFTLAAARTGCRHIWATDHVLGADTARRPDWTGAYSLQHEFHEPLMLFAYIAALCDLELVTGVIVLPQRQTALVAKQAAELDLLCKGRLRLGVGIGWNSVEYEALGMDFSKRGQRIEEQIALLRKLWTESSVDFRGAFDHVDGAGIAPLPIQRPIPIWMGSGNSPQNLRRVGKLADGFLLRRSPDDANRTMVEGHLSAVRESAKQAGRDPSEIGVQGLLPVVGKSPADIRKVMDRWRALGATHVTIDPREVSTHINTELSMDQKLESRRSSTQLLIERLEHAAEILAHA
jgi:probable F420-dependent oxidoreductase